MHTEKKIRHAYTQKAKILYTVNKWGEQSIKIEFLIPLKYTMFLMLDKYTKLSIKYRTIVTIIMPINSHITRK